MKKFFAPDLSLGQLFFAFLLQAVFVLLPAAGFSRAAAHIEQPGSAPSSLFAARDAEFGGARDDPSPAPSVPVVELPVDGLGRLQGTPKPIESPSFVPAKPYSPEPETASPSAWDAGAADRSFAPLPVPPGGAGPIDDPRAPASPVVVQEFEVGPTGRIIGPLRPEQGRAGLSPSSAPSALPPAAYAPPPAFSEPSPPAARPGIVPLNEHGPAAYPGRQGVFFPGQTAPTAEARESGMTPDRAANAHLLNLVNQERALGRFCGETRMPPAAPLRNHPALASTAQAHADDMAAKGYFSSSSPQGQSLDQRISASGYVWDFVAENIAGAAPYADKALESWMSAPDQCRNLMSADYVDAGIGYNATRNLWVFTLASPMQTAP